MFNVKEKMTFVKTTSQLAMYPHLLEARTDPWGHANYDITLVLDDSARADLEAAILAEYEAHKSVLADENGKIPPVEAIHWPLYYCDDPEKKDLYEKWCIHFKSAYRPGVIDRDWKEITDLSSLYSGMYCRVAANLKCYRNGANAGIAAYLQAVQKTADGDRLSGASSAADVFADSDGEEELPF